MWFTQVRVIYLCWFLFYISLDISPIYIILLVCLFFITIYFTEFNLSSLQGVYLSNLLQQTYKDYPRMLDIKEGEDAETFFTILEELQVTA